MNEPSVTTADHEWPDPEQQLATAGPPEVADEFDLGGMLIDGRYLVEAPVARGGFGLVYRARHLRFDATVAIKVLRIPSQLTGGHREAVIDRLLWEGKVLFELGGLHASIVRVLEAGTVATSVGVTGYLAMEWVNGISLDAELKQRRGKRRPPHSLQETLALVEPVIDALALAHARGVAHCDIKPGNLLVVDGAEPTLKLLDFGLAKVVGTAGRWLARSDSLRGFTRAYAAPEQWLPRLGRTGPWTDVYALALVCVELLAGARAFQGDEAHMMAACLDECARPTLRRLGGRCSDALESVFARALAVKPKDRFVDAAAFGKAFRAAAQSPSRSTSPRFAMSWTALTCSALLLGPASWRVPHSASLAQPLARSPELPAAPALMRAAPEPASVQPASHRAPSRQGSIQRPTSALPAPVANEQTPTDLPRTDTSLDEVTSPRPSPDEAAPDRNLQDLFEHDELSRRN